MKHLKFILCTILFITVLLGCASENFKTKQIKNNSKEKVVEPRVEESIPLGLYQNIKGTRNLTQTYTSNLIMYKDIISLEVFYTNASTLTGNQLELWNQYQNEQNITGKKIGYMLDYKIENREIKQIILSPSDTEKITDDIIVYLYDDIIPHNGRYSHITKEEYNENTTLSSIKLVSGTNIDKISSPITLTAFVYDESNSSKFLGTYQTKIQSENEK